VWYNNLGVEYIDRAFRYAHDADPDADLFYNDFNLERDLEKLNAAINLVTDLKANGTPIAGLGLQMHLRMDIPNDSIANALEKAAATGLKIHLSEMDIIFNTHNDSKGGGIQRVDQITQSLLEEQANKYKSIAQMYRDIVPEKQRFGISFWGFNDRDTWINHFFNLNDWPTLFDTNLDEKPAYYGFAEGLL
jgi:endo-1,4-beta-xylanase